MAIDAFKIGTGVCGQMEEVVLFVPNQCFLPQLELAIFRTEKF
jgi:hypothetical protein